MLTTLLSLLLFAAPAHPSVPTVCPADEEGPRAVVERLLVRSTFAAVRDSLALTGKGPADLRPLRDAVDAHACQRLTEMFGTSAQNPEWQWSAYQVGSYYMVAFRRVPHAGTPKRLGWSPLYVLDGSFNPVRSELL
jgi:hypothetical protein